MSAAWLKLIPILCLSCTALTDRESGRVVWRNFGGAVMIQCSPPEPVQELLSVKRGLMENTVLTKDITSDTIGDEFKGRLQLSGAFPNIDVLIQNLTSDDTGPYWCFYTKFDQKANKVINKKSNGSLLLVVTDKPKECDPENTDPILVSVVVSAVALVGVTMGFLMWVILKKKNTHTKSRHIPTNDVYEDMRGTLRR